jgi:hypothetical protein
MPSFCIRAMFSRILASRSASYPLAASNGDTGLLAAADKFFGGRLGCSGERDMGSTTVAAAMVRGAIAAGSWVFSEAAAGFVDQDGKKEWRQTREGAVIIEGKGRPGEPNGNITDAGWLTGDARPVPTTFINPQ